MSWPEAALEYRKPAGSGTSQLGTCLQRCSPWFLLATFHYSARSRLGFELLGGFLLYLLLNYLNWLPLHTACLDHAALSACSFNVSPFRGPAAHSRSVGCCCGRAHWSWESLYLLDSHAFESLILNRNCSKGAWHSPFLCRLEWRLRSKIHNGCLSSTSNHLRCWCSESWLSWPATWCYQHSIEWVSEDSWDLNTSWCVDAGES